MLVHELGGPRQEIEYNRIQVHDLIVLEVGLQQIEFEYSDIDDPDE